MSNKRVLLLAIICGLLTALAVNYYLKSIEESILNVQTKMVAVANVRIPARTVITVDMLSFRKIPAEYVHQSSVDDAAGVIGYVTRSDIDNGEQILKTKLTPREDTGNSFAYTVPLGMRAVSIKLKEAQGVTYLLSPGDTVDVLGMAVIEITNPDPNVDTIKEVKTHLVMENAIVLAVRDKFSDANSATDDKKDKGSDDMKTVTLAVPPEKMQLIVHLAFQESLYLALRSPADKSEQARPPMDEKVLLR